MDKESSKNGFISQTQGGQNAPLPQASYIHGYPLAIHTDADGLTT